MKQFFFVACALTITGLAANAQTKTTTKTAAKPATSSAKPGVTQLKNTTDSFSYALGMNVANNLKQQGIEQITYSAMQKAMEDVFKKRAFSMNDQTANSCIQQTLQANAANKTKGEKDKAAAFLATNKKRSGVIVLPSGLQYEIIKKGDPASATPKLTDTVVVNYIGTLIDGKEFDNSYKRGEALNIPVGGVIKGWTEILQLMHIGDKLKAYIPSDLAYGERGAAGGEIPGGAALIFEMELIGIKPVGAVAAPITPEPKQQVPAAGQNK
jgi:FKBP-type peptidyl-prolyl cis-trans isomerase